MPEPIRFYTDDQVAKAVSVGLRHFKADVARPPEMGTDGWPDDQHLAFAYAQGRMLITQDADFLRLHHQGAPHCGILYAKMPTAERRIIRRAAELFYEFDRAEVAGKIFFV